MTVSDSSEGGSGWVLAGKGRAKGAALTRLEWGVVLGRQVGAGDQTEELNQTRTCHRGVKRNPDRQWYAGSGGEKEFGARVGVVRLRVDSTGVGGRRVPVCWG